MMPMAFPIGQPANTPYQQEYGARHLKRHHGRIAVNQWVVGGDPLRTRVRCTSVIQLARYPELSCNRSVW
jgi:hypothetical protein